MAESQLALSIFPWCGPAVSTPTAFGHAADDPSSDPKVVKSQKSTAFFEGPLTGMPFHTATETATQSKCVETLSLAPGNQPHGMLENPPFRWFSNIYKPPNLCWGFPPRPSGHVWKHTRRQVQMEIHGSTQSDPNWPNAFFPTKTGFYQQQSPCYIFSFKDTSLLDVVDNK